MAREGHGCVVNVLGDVDDAEGIIRSKHIVKEYKGIRSNVVARSKGYRSTRGINLRFD
jgi:hypothetical protein